jgi:hypothetical protein
MKWISKNQNDMREGGRDQIKYLFDLANLIDCL